MIGVDTTVVVRYLVRDDKAQALRAKRFFDRCRERDETCFVGLIVLCEMAWVLSSCYRRSRAEVAEAIGLVLSAAQFEVERKDVARRALEEYAAGNGDFADQLIGHVSISEGCSSTVTLDDDLRRSTVFTRI